VDGYWRMAADYLSLGKACVWPINHSVPVLHVISRECKHEQMVIEVCQSGGTITCGDRLDIINVFLLFAS
jgi:hypothetical protein